MLSALGTQIGPPDRFARPSAGRASQWIVRFQRWLARSRAGLPDDAPVRPAIHLGPLARFGRPKNSADPRAGVRATLPGPADIAAVLGLPGTATLRMPALHLR